MSVGISFTLISFFYNIMLTTIYSIKKKITSTENKIYKALILITLIGSFEGLFCYYGVKNYNVYPIFAEIVSKGYLVFLLAWFSTFSLYVIFISNIQKYQEKKNVMKALYFICAIAIIILFLIVYLPIEYISEGIAVYTSGSSVLCVYALSALYFISWIFCVLKNITKLNKKFIPVLLNIFLLATAVTFQKINPSVLLVTSSLSFVTFIMYFTIENPDIKLLEEVHKSKEISDNANEEKTLFLYNMTQEIRKTTDIVDDYAKLILESDDWDEAKDAARTIMGENAKFNNMTNEILDVSSIESKNIKVYKSRYNLKTILKEVITIYTKECKNKELDFRTNIDHNVPDYLYGDSINLKEALNTSINNSLKRTSTGYIELSVNAIIKNDICRLIITIEDSSKGLTSEELNNIKKTNKEIEEANNIIINLNGTMLISSDYGQGTKIKIILDQKIEIQENETIKKYDSMLDNKKIMIVDDSEAGIKIIEKLLKDSKVDLEKVTNGSACLEKIKNRNKYDLILLDEELTDVSGEYILNKLKGIRNFNIPVILLTKDNSYEYNDKASELGFADYLLKPIKKEALLKIIDKYVK